MKKKKDEPKPNQPGLFKPGDVVRDKKTGKEETVEAYAVALYPPVVCESGAMYAPEEVELVGRPGAAPLSADEAAERPPGCGPALFRKLLADQIERVLEAQPPIFFVNGRPHRLPPDLHVAYPFSKGHIELQVLGDGWKVFIVTKAGRTELARISITEFILKEEARENDHPAP